MYGAIIGDIVGSKYEFNNIKQKNFPLFSDGCFCTDDSTMTVAVASALIKSIKEKSPFKDTIVTEMQKFGRKYPSGGYGGMFSLWLKQGNPLPYNSFGNGSAMRVSPCGIIAVTLDEALMLSKTSAEVTHNHPEGIKGAQATAAAIFLAKNGKSKPEIREYINKNFYVLNKTLDEIRPTYYFDVSCQGTVPPAIIAFLESVDYEDAIRNAISLGGDSDTIGAITGAIAWSYYEKNQLNYSRMIEIKSEASKLIPQEFIHIIDLFDNICINRKEEYNKTGNCPCIL